MLSDLQKSKIQNLFHMFDTDINGMIEKSDIVRIINTCSARFGWERGGLDYKEFETHFLSMWAGMVKRADKNQDQQVSLQEFLDFYSDLLDSPEEYQVVLGGLGGAIFGTFDVNFDGELTLGEYKEFYAAMGLSTGFATTIFARLDLNTNGRISIRELTILLDEFFSSQDPNAPGNFLFGPVQD